MGCCLIRSAEAEDLLPTGVNPSKNPSNAGDSPVILSPRRLPAMFVQYYEFNPVMVRTLSKKI